MKQLILNLMTTGFIVLLFTGLASCGDDDDDDKSHIENVTNPTYAVTETTWTSSITDEYAGGTITLYLDSNGGGTITRVYNQNGQTERYSYDLTYELPETHTGTFRYRDEDGNHVGTFVVSGNKITLYLGENLLVLDKNDTENPEDPADSTSTVAGTTWTYPYTGEDEQSGTIIVYLNDKGGGTVTQVHTYKGQTNRYNYDLTYKLTETNRGTYRFKDDQGNYHTGTFIMEGNQMTVYNTDFTEGIDKQQFVFTKV